MKTFKFSFFVLLGCLLANPQIGMADWVPVGTIGSNIRVQNVAHCNFRLRIRNSGNQKTYFSLKGVRDYRPNQNAQSFEFGPLTRFDLHALANDGVATTLTSDEIDALYASENFPLSVYLNVSLGGGLPAIASINTEYRSSGVGYGLTGTGAVRLERDCD